MERELARVDPPLEDRKRRDAKSGRERPRRERGRLGAVFARSGGKRAQEVGRDERHVGRKDDAELRLRKRQSGRHADDRGASLATVVEDRERQREPIFVLADDDHTREGSGERSVRALCERRPADRRERLRRPEPAARAADEENARYVVIRHASE